MKAPHVVLSAKIIGEFKAEIHFDDGSTRVVDFKKAPLKGAFKKAQTDLKFFKTLSVRAGYVVWQGDLTIDGDFLYEHGEQQLAALPATGGFLNKVKRSYKA